MSDLSEENNLAEDLRIIATEKRLTAADRAKIIQAAEYFEQTQVALTQAYRELSEVTAQRIAATERLLELRPPSWQISSGWVRIL